MLAQFDIDESLARQIIHFLGQSWIKDSQFYGYNSQEASKHVIQYIEGNLLRGLSISWSLGGNSNNCWGESVTVSAEIEPDLPFLDDFFIEFYPQLSFMQYKVVSKFIQRDTYPDNDYYGGSTQKSRKSLSFEDLYKGMIKAKIITDPKIINLSSLKDFIKDSYSVEIMSETFKPKKIKKIKS